MQIKIIKPKMKSLNNFIYKNFKQSLKDLKLIKSYLIFSALLFLIITLIGAIFPAVFQEQIIELIKKLIEQTKSLTSFELTRFIIANNIKSSFIAFVFGILFGIIPLMVIIVNAYILGFVIKQAIALEGPLIIWRLFPHGIFEIPAILISISLGLRLGFFLFIYKPKNKQDTKLKQFLSQIKQSLRIFILIVVPLLVIAGIIEGILITLL